MITELLQCKIAKCFFKDKQLTSRKTINDVEVVADERVNTDRDLKQDLVILDDCET